MEPLDLSAKNAPHYLKRPYFNFIKAVLYVQVIKMNKLLLLMLLISGSSALATVTAEDRALAFADSFPQLKALRSSYEKCSPPRAIKIKPVQDGEGILGYIFDIIYDCAFKGTDETSDPPRVDRITAEIEAWNSGEIVDLKCITILPTKNSFTF